MCKVLMEVLYEQQAFVLNSFTVRRQNEYVDVHDKKKV